MATSNQISISIIMLFNKCYIKGIHSMCPFETGFSLLCLVPGRFIHISVCVNTHSFLLPSSVFHAMDVPVFPYSLTDGHWILSKLQLLQINIPVQISVWKYIFIFWDKCPRVQLLGLLVTPLISWKGIARIFYKVAAPSYISTRTIGGIQFLWIPWDLVLPHFFVLAVLIGM